MISIYRGLQFAIINNHCKAVDCFLYQLNQIVLYFSNNQQIQGDLRDNLECIWKSCVANKVSALYYVYVFKLIDMLRVIYLRISFWIDNPNILWSKRDIFDIFLGKQNNGRSYLNLLESPEYCEIQEFYVSKLNILK